MPGLEADTSSYNQPLPVSPLEIAKQIGGLQQQQQQIQSGALTISKQKLDLVNTQFGLMNKELSILADDLSITKPKAAERLSTFAKTHGFPPEVSSHMLGELDSAPDVETFAKTALKRGLDNQAFINNTYGAGATQNDNRVNRSGMQTGPLSTTPGAFVPQTETPVQVPPTQPNVDPNRNLPNGQPNPNYLQPGIVGPAGPSGVVPVPRARPMPVAPLQAPAAASGPTGPTQQTGFDFKQRFAGEPRIVTGASPGTAAAIGAVSEQSGKDFASDLTRAKNLQSDLYPAERALEIVKELGPQGFGPGTEGLNTVKSAIATWLPNVDQKTIDGVSNFEQARKYLTQIARASGATGTNDQLAAAFEANPSVKMNSASIENVLKSVIALRKMQAAQTLMAANANIPPEQYSQWIAKNQNQFDARAFAVDMMDDKAKAKLYDSLKKDKNAYQKFEKTLQFAHDAELVGK